MSDDLKDRLERLASLRRQPPDGLVLEAVRQYVEREEARESFLQEAEVSWAEYGETGRHLTADETAEWLGRWGTEAETPAPKCHE